VPSALGLVGPVGNVAGDPETTVDYAHVDVNEQIRVGTVTAALLDLDQGYS
jgi:hypothetical protein